MMSIYAELLQRSIGRELDSQNKEYLDIIVAASQRMSGLVRDLLNYSRVASDKRRSLDTTDMNTVVATALNACELVIAETAAVIDVDPLPSVLGASDLLVAVVQNLVTNAIKIVSLASVPTSGSWPSRPTRTPGRSALPTMASASNRNIRTASGAYSSGCTGATCPAPASAWRPSKPSSSNTADGYGSRAPKGSGPRFASDCVLQNNRAQNRTS